MTISERGDAAAEAEIARLRSLVATLEGERDALARGVNGLANDRAEAANQRDRYAEQIATERASHAAALAALRERCAVVADNAAAHADKHYHKHGFALSGGSVASRIADKIRALPIGAEGGEG